MFCLKWLTLRGVGLGIGVLKQFCITCLVTNFFSLKHHSTLMCIYCSVLPQFYCALISLPYSQFLRTMLAKKMFGNKTKQELFVCGTNSVSDPHSLLCGSGSRPQSNSIWNRIHFQGGKIQLGIYPQYFQ